MADFRLPGPVDGSRQRAILDDGTLMRRASAPPGSLRGGTATQADEFDPWALLRRAACVKEAAERARGRVPAAVLRETGEAIEALIEGLLPGLLMMMAVLGVSVGIGGAAGAAIGVLAGGVGALPGAAIGAKAGASVGIWLLTWLGLGFLAVEIGRGLVELGGRCLDAVRIAWDAHGQSDREARIDRAADGLAEAVALLLKLILMAIVARLTMSQAGAAGRSAASSVDEMVAALRQSRLGAGFADWVAANAARLTRNPKLQMHRQVQGTQAVSDAATPSQLRKGKADAPEPAPPKPVTKAPQRQDTRNAKYKPDDHYKDDKGNWKWPDKDKHPDGFENGMRERKLLEVDQRIDRFGPEEGSFLSPEGTPFEQRALPPSSADEAYHVYQVKKPLPVDSGKVVTAFDQPGGGTQFKIRWQELADEHNLAKVTDITRYKGADGNGGISWLVDNGYLQRMTPVGGLGP